MNMYNPNHLYIHWPFCSTKCFYCDFTALEQHEQFQYEYHQALCKEIGIFFSTRQKNIPIETIFIGGGTPSLYPEEWMHELWQHLSTYIDLDTIKEITLETNPADITEEKLQAWVDGGINRISIGIQALNDDVLLKLNRRQRISDVVKAMRLVPKYFDNISADFILGLPEITSSEWIEKINTACSWPLSHISIYFLTIHEKTPLYFSVEKGAVKIADDDILVNLYHETITLLERNDFIQYEISNFARNGHESLHNKAYWNRRSYKGFGLGASSFDGEKRSINTKNLTHYLKMLKNNQPIEEVTEVLNKDQILLETIMLQLRQKNGLQMSNFTMLFDKINIKRIQKNLADLIHAQVIQEKEDGAIILTPKGMALENEVVIRLLN